MRVITCRGTDNYPYGVIIREPSSDRSMIIQWCVDQFGSQYESDRYRVDQFGSQYESDRYRYAGNLILFSNQDDRNWFVLRWS
jgi:hypothetical protein